MCGIAGWISPKVYDEAILQHMTDALEHRGPDAEGHVHLGPAHLGHRRLSILDLAGSVQPMTSPDGTIVLTFNGEIYNFLEIRQELKAKGYVFNTKGDTEVVLAAWCTWGPDMVSHLDGMFSFVIWDSRQSLLFAGRDRFGEKPFSLLVGWHHLCICLRTGPITDSSCRFKRGQS